MQKCFLLAQITSVHRPVDQRPESAGCERLPTRCLHHPGDGRLAFLQGIEKQLVTRAERIEPDVAVSQQMLAPFLGQPVRIRKYLHGISLGEVHDGVDLAPRHEFVDEDIGLALEFFLQAAQQARRHDAVEDAACPVMQRRVRLEEDAWGPPRRFFSKIRNADACRRAKRLPIQQYRTYVGISSEAQDRISRRRTTGPASRMISCSLWARTGNHH